MSQSIETSFPSTLTQIRRLWSQTSDERSSESFASVETELQEYYVATICNILALLHDLEKLSSKNSPEEFVAAFEDRRSRIIRQLRLLSEIGRLVLPNSVANQGGEPKQH
jgi:hypothetical protein